MAGMPNHAVDEAGAVVEKLAPSGGRNLGYVSVGLLLVVAVGSAAAGVVANHEVILACVAAGLIGWVALIRPVAVAHSQGLLLRNMARDTFIPWSKVERCAVHQTLQVATPEGMFHGLGVSRSARSLIKSDTTVSAMQMRGTGFLGFCGGGGVGSSTNPSRRANEEASGGDYTDYISARILDLARRGKDVEGETAVAWDPVPVTAVVVAAVCVALVLL
ncbi:MAG: hypothetical protein M3Q82_04960 [Actinomycetota bacterium]|nr:hypothetical protein [Actinomycetota bacterium]